MNDPSISKQIYSPDEQISLLRYLREERPQSPEHLHVRLRFELISHAKEVIEKWREMRNNLDKQLALIAKFDGLKWRLQQVQTYVSSEEFTQVLDEYGPTFRDKVVTNVEQTIRQIEAASKVYTARHGETPRGIKSEGKERSHNLALALLKEHIVVSSYIWYQGTEKRPQFGKAQEPYGNYSKFIFTSILPIILQLNRGKDGAALPTAWPSLCEILVRMKVRDLFKPDDMAAVDE
jgi:hypothetical protein